MIVYSLKGNNLSSQDRLILKVLKLYYEHNLTQTEVANRMGFSRPKVSKLLAEGRARGLVRIQLAQPAGDFTELEIALENRYGLPEALVVETADDPRATELAAGGAAGELLSGICDETTTLGLSWGRALRGLAEALPAQAFTCGRVVPLVGGMGRAQNSLHANQICSVVASKLGTECVFLTTPAMAPSPQSRAELAETPGIREALIEGTRCDVAVVGIGAVHPTSTIVQAGYLSLEDFLALGKRGVVGDICCHFIDGAGEPCCPEISDRVVGITLEQLKDIPKVIGIATGAEKAAGVAAALTGGYLDVLVTDRELAETLLNITLHHREEKGELA